MTRERERELAGYEFRRDSLTDMRKRQSQRCAQFVLDQFLKSINTSHRPTVMRRPRGAREHNGKDACARAVRNVDTQSGMLIRGPEC